MYVWNVFNPVRGGRYSSVIIGRRDCVVCGARLTVTFHDVVHHRSSVSTSRPWRKEYVCTVVETSVRLDDVRVEAEIDTAGVIYIIWNDHTHTRQQ